MSTSGISTYQGGIPFVYGRPGRGQRGGGFLSSLKRFLIPIGKAVLPSLIGGAADVILEKKPLSDTLKKRGFEAGKKALGATMHTAGDMLKKKAGVSENDPPGSSSSSPPPKRYKKGRKTISTNKRQTAASRRKKNTAWE